MSYRTLLKSFSVVAISAVIGYGAMKFIQKENSPNRYLASMTMGKMAHEQFSKTIFDIKVKNIEVGSTDSDVSTVQVTIDAFNEIPEGLSYSWHLPEDISVFAGSQQGLLPKFSANETQTLELKIKGYSKIKKSFISFSVEGALGAAKLKREVLLSSRPEDSFEYIVQNYEKSKKSEAKINNKLKKADYKPLVDVKNVVH